MSLTYPGKCPSTEDAVAILKAALEKGANFWNAGEHYGTAGYNSLHLLRAYFEKHPEDSDKVVVCVKSCFSPVTRLPAVDTKSVKESIERCIKVLNGSCRINVFQPGRLDPNVPVEETVKAVAEYVQAGSIGSLGLGECSAASIRRASKITPVALAEIEVSLFERSCFHNGVADACKELNVPIVAFSPLSKGLLTGTYRHHDDIPEGDIRKKFFPRFGREAFEQNSKVVDEVETVAMRKGCTISQVGLAWVAAQGERISTPVMPIPSVSSIARVDENMTDIRLTRLELQEIDEVLGAIEIQGGRAPAGMEQYTEV